MTSADLSVSTGILEIGMALLALGLLFGAWLSRRANIEPLGDWPLAWASLIAVGALRLAGAPRAFEYAGTAVFAALMLSGANRYADRAVPKALFPVAAVVAATLPILVFLGLPQVAAHATLGLAPMVLLACGLIVHSAARRRDATWIHRILPLGFAGIAILGFLDHVVMKRNLDAIGLWLVVGIPIATSQAVAVFDRIRDRADRIALELEGSVSLLQATLDSTADGILVVDLSGRYTSFNRVFREMWALPDDVLEAGVSEVALQFVKNQLKDGEAFYSGVKSLYADPSAESFDTLDFLDGRVIERYSTPQRVGDEIVGRVWSFRDVTARKRMEELERQRKSRLEELVEERTRELVESENRLRQADRLAAIGTLAAGVAHQINNPVGAILNSAEFALVCDEEPDAKEIFKKALIVNAAEAKRCGDIVRAILQFARHESVERTVEDFNQIIRRSLRAVDEYANERGARIEIELDHAPLDVRVGALEIEQVVVNLLRNAIESRSDGVVVAVRSECAGEVARLQIRDNGAGIAQSDQTRAFDPFFSTRLTEGGTGLGLSVAHGIVTDHAGTIALESEVDIGTTVSVELPLVAPGSPEKETT